MVSRSSCGFNMASENVRELCRAHVYCDLKQHIAVVQKRDNIASRKPGVKYAPPASQVGWAQSRCR